MIQEKNSKKFTKDVTRKRILDASIKIFSLHPYHAASIRMIGKEGGFDHPLVNYYYPTKADLFEAVMKHVCDEFYRENISWYNGLMEISLEKGFPRYLERMIKYNMEHPSFLRIVSLNLSQSGKVDSIPGYDQIIDILAKARETFENNVAIKASPEKTGMFINSFNALMVSFLGAGYSQAKVIGLYPGSTEYREWVKNAFYYLFIDHLRDLIKG